MCAQERQIATFKLGIIYIIIPDPIANSSSENPSSFISILTGQYESSIFVLYFAIEEVQHPALSFVKFVSSVINLL